MMNGMAVLAVDALTVSPCDDCDRKRTIVTERAPDERALIVVVLDGCSACEGSWLLVAEA